MVGTKFQALNMSSTCAWVCIYVSEAVLLQLGKVFRLLTSKISAMPLVAAGEDKGPDIRYMIMAVFTDRKFWVIFISGVCSLSECRSFVSACAKDKGVPLFQQYFEAEDMDVLTWVIRDKTGRLRFWQTGTLGYFAEAFQECAFTDAYTFHTSRHFLEEAMKHSPEYCSNAP